MNKEVVKNLYQNVKALEDAMKFIYRTSDQADLFPFTNYKTFMRKYNELAIRATTEIEGPVIFDVYNLDNVKDWAETVRPLHKQYFDAVLGNVALLKSTLENHLDIKNEMLLNLKDFLSANLRRAVLKEPDNESYIQDTIEQLLIGRGYAKGLDYDREVGRVKVSIKEYKPDFVFLRLDLALEIKLSKTKAKSKEIVDEINADIQAYSKRYSQLLFLVYDLGTIRDEEEFKNDIDNNADVQLMVVKH